MKEYICKKDLISRIESESRMWGEDYDAQQILGDIEDFPAVTDLDICKLFATRFIYIVKSTGKQMGVELDDTTVMEIFNMMFSEMESEK